MQLTASEQATFHFYEWEYLGRGYYHFDYGVMIEPPFKPFYHKAFNQIEQKDDGRVPSLFNRIGKLLGNNESKIVEKEKEVEIEPKLATLSKSLICLSLSFPKGQEISSIISIEFLNMLSFTKNPISFEIIGSFESINIQIVCGEDDRIRIQSHLQAYFTNISIQEQDAFELGFDLDKEVAIADFGLKDEFMRPISIDKSFSIDPLTSLIATLDNLLYEDIVIFQVIFQGVTSPWSNSILNSVSDGIGGSFFSDSPEMLSCAVNKVSAPLFSSIMRIGAQGNSNERSRYLAIELARSITSISGSEYNKLIPLSNEGYNYDFHLQNIYNRTSNRLGMILNTKELVSFVHYPNKTVVSQKLNPQTGKTKLLPKECLNQKYVLGINNHNGIENTASIDDETFGKHIVIGGSTGTGKTHLLKQLISFDIKFKNSTIVIDPHGDLIQDLLNTISDDKKDNVVYINIADEDYSFGFNLFDATTEAEKTVLASDLASAFADTWISSGDRIQSVLQKTISTLIYSEKEASILDMKRFLLEKDFRNKFVSSLDDPILEYYWQNEFPLVRRNELSPLLLRIDSFMQTRLLRNIFCQTKGIDFKELIEERKLVLIQLSVGLIGLENSKFLARLIIAKINQIAFSRQSLDINKRQPIHLYIDEAHNYANSPVIEQILSGARKYNLSLVLVLQHLEQVQNNLLNSILTNTATQIFFRQSDKDSKRISSSYSYFEAEDFMELDLGEALVKVNKRSNDFNLKTLLLNTGVGSSKEYIINISRQKYAQSKEYIQELLKTLLPKKIQKRKPPNLQNIKKEDIETSPLVSKKNETKDNIQSELETEKKSYLKQAKEQQEITKHRSLQNFVRSMSIQRGFKVNLEEETPSGGRVDIGLTKNDIRIAIEISVTNSIEYEVKNIKKCIDADYNLIYMISESKVHLKNIEKRVKEVVNKSLIKRVFFFSSSELSTYLDAITHKKEKQTKRVNGWRVNVNFHADDSDRKKQSSLSSKILKALKKKK